MKNFLIEFCQEIAPFIYASKLVVMEMVFVAFLRWEGGYAMIIGVPKEIKNNENRVGLTPAGAEALTKAGHKVLIERGCGLGSGFSDDSYTAERLRRRFYHLTLKLKKKRNIAVAAVARELSCFIWGMMTERIS